VSDTRTLPDDDERTAVTGPPSGGAPGPVGGNALPIGHQLQEYVIEGLVGEGGFGIVYLARDTQLGRVVALKEYMPSSLASRVAAHGVSVRSEKQRETFLLGLRSFVNEAKLLASFDHPSLVKVYRFWEANGTAYMVMPFYQGQTLKQWLTQHGPRPEESWLRGLLHQLIDALEVMHNERCFHRDIAPDNILLLQTATQFGGPQTLRAVLLDFGAARRVIGDATQMLTVILKSGYAPIEQYAESTSMRQGPWTDVYALCAVLYASITGKAPPPSVNRMVRDDMVLAQQAAAGRYTPHFLAAIDAGLSVRPENRPQDMASLRAMFDSPAAVTLDLDEPGTVAMPRASDMSTTLNLGQQFTTTQVLPRRESAGEAPPAYPTQPMVTPMRASPPAPRVAPPPQEPLRMLPEPTRKPVSRAPLFIGGAVAAIALAAAAWWLAGRTDAPAAVPSVAETAPATPAASAPAPTVAVSPAPTVAQPALPAVPFSLVAALQDIVRVADSRVLVTTTADKPTVTIGADPLQFRVKSNEAGYVYVYLSGPTKNHLYLLFPNGIDKNNRIEANQEMLLPRTAWRITAGGPAGTDHIVTMVTRNPRDLSRTGLSQAGEDFPGFDLKQVEALWAQRSAAATPLAGVPACAAGATSCDAAYGASLLVIDEVGAPR
jgi:serine/threonine protein kinase